MTTRLSRSIKTTRLQDENYNYQQTNQSHYLSKSTSSFSTKPRRSISTQSTKSVKQSKSLKARPGWQDPTVKDPSIYRLSDEELLERKLKRMSKRQLCEIAGIPYDEIESPQPHYDEQACIDEIQLENEFPWMNQPNQQLDDQSSNQFIDHDEYQPNNQPSAPPNSRASSRPVSAHGSRLNQTTKPSTSRPISANQSTNRSNHRSPNIPRSQQHSPHQRNNQPNNQQSNNQSDNQSTLESRVSALLGRLATHIDGSNKRVEQTELRLVECESRLIDTTDRLLDCERRMAAMEEAFLVLTEHNQSIKQELTETMQQLETQTIIQTTELVKRISTIEEKAAARAAKKRQALLATRLNPSSHPAKNLNESDSLIDTPVSKQSIQQSTNQPSRAQRSSSSLSIHATPIQPSNDQQSQHSSQRPTIHSRTRPHDSRPFVPSMLSTPQSVSQLNHQLPQEFNDSLFDTPQSVHQARKQITNPSLFTIPSLSDDDTIPRSTLPSPYKPQVTKR